MWVDSVGWVAESVSCGCFKAILRLNGFEWVGRLHSFYETELNHTFVLKRNVIRSYTASVVWSTGILNILEKRKKEEKKVITGQCFTGVFVSYTVQLINPSISLCVAPPVCKVLFIQSFLQLPPVLPFVCLQNKIRCVLFDFGLGHSGTRSIYGNGSSGSSRNGERFAPKPAF